MTTQLEVNLLGGITFLLNGRPVQSVPTRAAQALLIYLLHQPHPVARERLVDMFYQASEPKQAAANLRSTLSRLRKELRPFLAISHQTVGIAPDASVVIDSATFAAQAAAGEWEQALALYQGEFLAGFYLREAPEFEEWALLERERLRLLAVEGLQKLVAARQQRGEHWAALQAVTQLLGIEPLLENIHREKMLLLARTGQRPLALQQYKTAVTLFETELGIAVSAETTTLYERLARLAWPPPCVLPARRRHFVGRTAELTAVQTALVDANRRLITIVGAGGMGKTRLAEEVARRIHAEAPGHFLDGVYFVALAGVVGGATAVDALATHIAQAIGAPLNGRQPPAQQLLAYLQGREMLLILDNFEQLLETAVDTINQFLQKAPHLTLLVTSRERLNLYEETVLTLGGLPTPAADAPPEEPNAAVQLFLQNIQQHNLNFTPSPQTLETIGAICRLLDGVPLGIELAAGWAHRDAVSEIARQIEQSAAFLATDLRNVPARQRSLRAVFLHSWDLLAADLRPILATLAIFPAHFSVEAAVEVAQASKGALDALVDKSLLQKVGDAEYAIHPLLREFAGEQLEETAVTQARHRHARYFASFIAERSHTQHQPTYFRHLPQLVAVYDDLILAWEWAVGQLFGPAAKMAWEWVAGLQRPLIRLHLQRNWFYAARTLFGAARQAVEQAGWQEETAVKQQRLLHAQLTVAENNSARILGDTETSHEAIGHVIPLLRASADLDTLFDAYNAQAGIAMQRGDLDSVPALLDEMEAIAVETKRPIFHGVLAVLRSYYMDYRGETAVALALAQKGLEAFRATENSFYEAMVLDGIARRLFTLQRPDEAADALRRAYAIAAQNEQTLTQAFALKGLAFYHRERGELTEAEAALAESRELFTAVNDQRNMVEIDLSAALIAYQRQAWAEMTRHLHASLTRAQRLQMKAQMLEGVACLPILQAQRGKPKQAYSLAHFVLAQEGVGDAPRQMAEEALALATAQLPASAQQEAQEAAAQTTLDEIVASFLGQGLKWGCGLTQ